MIYEIINPSDPVTIEADDVLVAKAATLFLGSGAYGLEDEEGNMTMGIYLFGGPTEEALTKEGFLDLVQFIKDHREDVARCLDSAVVCRISERVAVRAAVGSDLAAMNRYNEAKRSSLNNIAGAAALLAARLRETAGVSSL